MKLNNFIQITGVIIGICLSFGASADNATTKPVPGQLPGEHSAIKMTAPLSFDFVTVGDTRVGIPFTVELEITSQAATEEIAITLNTTSGLEITAPQDSYTYNNITSGQTIVLPVEMTLLRDTPQRLNIIAKIQLADGMMTTSFSIPFNMPDKARAGQAGPGFQAPDNGAPASGVYPAIQTRRPKE